MSNPEAIRWQEPRLIINEEEDTTQLFLGSVDVPEHVDLETTEKVLALVTELINQMVEEDILPELLSPDNESYADDLTGYYPDDDDDEPYLGDDDELFDDDDDDDY